LRTRLADTSGKAVLADNLAWLALTHGTAARTKAGDVVINGAIAIIVLAIAGLDLGANFSGTGALAIIANERSRPAFSHVAATGTEAGDIVIDRAIAIVVLPIAFLWLRTCFSFACGITLFAEDGSRVTFANICAAGTKGWDGIVHQPIAVVIYIVANFNALGETLAAIEGILVRIEKISLAA
jgi:hypothetical protein